MSVQVGGDAASNEFAHDSVDGSVVAGDLLAFEESAGAEMEDVFAEKLAADTACTRVGGGEGGRGQAEVQAAVDYDRFVVESGERITGVEVGEGIFVGEAQEAGALLWQGGQCEELLLHVLVDDG